MRAESMSEQESSEAARPLDSEIAKVLVDNHRELLRFVERRVGRRDVAEDILQEAFARGLPKLETLRDGEAVTAWFYRTLRNAIIDHHRRGQVADRALAQFAAEIETAQEPPDAVRDEVCKCVARLAGTLKTDYAEALQRIDVDGLSMKTFADERGITAGNAAVRVHRAREALRRQVAVSCGSCAEHGCLSCTCGPAEPAAK